MATNLTPPWNLLGPAARVEWRRTTRWLAARGILHDLDQNLLIAYAIAWERYLEAEVKVQELGQVIRTDRGDEVLNPWLKISDQARVRILEIGKRFGFTPMSRKRMGISISDTGEKDSRWDRLRSL